MLRRVIIASLLVASVLSLAGCGGGSSPKTTGTKTAAKTATKQRTTTPTKPLTGTPPPTETAVAGAPSEAPAQPSEAPVATRPPPVEQPTDTPVPGPAGVDVGLVEFAVGPAPGSAPAGPITFTVHNDGTIVHNFLVIRGDYAPEGLPYNPSTYTVDESQVNIVGRTPDLGHEGSAELPLTLSAGHYVLICNVPSHYQAGMRVSFTVQ